MQNSRHKHFIGLPFPGDTRGKEPVCHGRRGKRCGFHLWVGKSPGGGHGNPLPGESTDRSLVGCGPKGRTQRLDTTETTQHACAQTVLKSCARVLSSTIKPRAVLLLPGSPKISNYGHGLLLTLGHQHCQGSMIQDSQKQMILLLTSPQKVKRKRMLCHMAYIIHLTSFHHVGILSSHIITRRGVSTVQ